MPKTTRRLDELVATWRAEAKLATSDARYSTYIDCADELEAALTAIRREWCGACCFHHDPDLGCVEAAKLVEAVRLQAANERERIKATKRALATAW